MRYPATTSPHKTNTFKIIDKLARKQEKSTKEKTKIEATAALQSLLFQKTRDWLSKAMWRERRYCLWPIHSRRMEQTLQPKGCSLSERVIKKTKAHQHQQVTYLSWASAQSYGLEKSPLKFHIIGLTSHRFQVCIYTIIRSKKKTKRTPPTEK